MFDRRDCPEMDRNLLEAAWRFQVVAPLLPGRMSRQERTEHRKALLKEPVDHPWRGRLPLSARTLRRWCKIAREGGMAGLVASARKDRGTMKRFPAAALKRALELREEDATRGTTILMRLILAENPEWKGILSYTTLGRHLRAAGSRRGQRVDRKGPFISFEAAAPHDLWQGDILYGPPVLHKGKPVRSMVVCWLDDRSRAVCHLEAYPDQSQAAIEDSLRKAIAKHGAPVSVFVDYVEVNIIHVMWPSRLCDDAYEAHCHGGLLDVNGSSRRNIIRATQASPGCLESASRLEGCRARLIAGRSTRSAPGPWPSSRYRSVRNGGSCRGWRGRASLG